MPAIRIAVDGTEKSIPLEKPEVELGRDYKSDVRLKDAKASRHHCRIVKVAEGYKLVDGGSSNGTFVNGQQVKERMLAPGDRIQIGLTTITFEASPGARAVVTPPTNGTAHATPTNGAAAALARTTAAREKASERFVREASKKRMNPLGVVVALCAALLAGVTLWQWFRKSPVDPQWVIQQWDRLMVEGQAAESEFSYDAAVAKYREARVVVEPIAELHTRVVDSDAHIKEAERNKQGYLEAERRRREFETECDRPDSERKPVTDLIDMANRLLSDYKEAKFPWLKSVAQRRDELIGKLPKSAELQFYEARKKVAEDLKLDSLEDGRFGEAIKFWREQFPARSAEEVRAKVGDEIKRMNEMSGRAADKAKRKAERMVQSDGRVWAADYLDKQLERLAGTDGEAKLRDELRKYK